MGRILSVALGRRFASATLAVLLLMCRAALAQFQPPSEYLNIQADHVSTWTDDQASVVEIQGPVVITTDRARMTANSAVIWLTPVPGSVLEQYHAEIALVGNASLEQPQVQRTGETLYVPTDVRGAVRLSKSERIAQNLSTTDLYRTAQTMRPLGQIPVDERPAVNDWVMQRPWLTPTTEATTMPTTQSTKQLSPVLFHADVSETIQTPDDKVAFVLHGHVYIFQTKPDGDFMEMQAEHAVMFTTLGSIKDAASAGQMKKAEDAVSGAYLEGDVRINYEAKEQTGKARSEQRMLINRVFYDFSSDRAVMTDAVIHALEPVTQTPIVIRANNIRQLSMGEYRTNHSELTTSSFAVPSYSIKSDRAYIREYDTGDPALGMKTVFDARNNTVNMFGLPMFYWPVTAGSITQRGFPLRSILVGSGSGYGLGIRTDWGLFESLGITPPDDVDADVRLDYFEERGPAIGLNGTYGGESVTDSTKQPLDFSGDLKSYFVEDHGTDRLGRTRHVEPEQEDRYNVQWQHQHFFPDDWQLQLRASLLSDPTFLPQYFTSEFNNGLPHDESVYLKHQTNTEAITLFGNEQPNDFVTTADMLQEQFEIERVPELGYYRIGDSLLDDQLTFFSQNTVSGLHFKRSETTLADLGFKHGLNPGLPSEGTTGTTDDWVYRGDFREEVDYPFRLGQFKLSPYVFGRLTPYSKRPDDDGSDTRVFGGMGARISTAFWKVDDTAENDLFDIHRLRHVVEPQLNVFTSATSVDRTDLYNYDEDVDELNDITAAQIAINQRWQTKRGGPGQWRNVDVFTLNVEANFFANQPDDQVNQPKGFRGLFFSEAPEESIPRNSINADALWRVSDTTAILADEEYNLDQNELATASIGSTIQRGDRLAYFLGLRYIGLLNSTIASVSTTYEISAKYSVRLAEALDLSEEQNQDTSITLIRKFDRFFTTFTVFYDAVDDTNGFRFGIFPEGLGYGLNSDQFQNAFGKE